MKDERFYKKGQLVTLNHIVYRVVEIGPLNECDALRDNNFSCKECMKLKRRMGPTMLKRINHEEIKL